MWVTWQSRIKVADEITVANHLAFKLADYLGLFGWAQCYCKRPYTGKMEAKKEGKRSEDGNRIRCRPAGFEDEGGGPRAKESWSLQKLEKPSKWLVSQRL